MYTPEIDMLIHEYVKWSVQGESVSLGYPKTANSTIARGSSVASPLISDDTAAAVWGALQALTKAYPDLFDIADCYWGIKGARQGRSHSTQWLIERGFGNPHQVFRQLEAVRAFVAGHMIAAGHEDEIIQLRKAIAPKKAS